MELELSEDQQVLLDANRRFLADTCGIAAVRELQDDPLGYDRAVWARAAELGWTSMLIPASHGGGALSEHGLSDLVIVAEEMGRTVAPGPLVAVNVVAEAIARAGTDDQRAEVLPGLLSGERTATWCGHRAVAGHTDGDMLVLDGVCSPVEAAVGASHLLVAVEGDDGTSQVLLPAGTDGMTVTPMQALDLVRRFAEVRFEGVRVPASAIVGGRGDAGADVERALQIACVLQCAEMTGVMDHVFEMTLEYLGDRWSFGRPLASYQALKHRVADDKMALEAAHAGASAAARAVATGVGDAPMLVSAAKVWIGPQATELVQDCIQLHGGIGVTWEHDLHLYLRRATTDRLTHGTPEDHAQRVAGLLLEDPDLPAHLGTAKIGASA